MYFFLIGNNKHSKQVSLDNNDDDMIEIGTYSLDNFTLRQHYYIIKIIIGSQNAQPIMLFTKHGIIACA